MQSLPEKEQGKIELPGKIAVAVQSADAFRALSKPFLDYIGRDLNVCHARAVEKFGDMIASATSLGLSIELYLKALMLLRGLRSEYTHDLLKLFEGLPPQVRASVEIVYKTSELPTNGDATSLRLRIGTDDLLKRVNRSPPTTPADNSLTAVLGRCTDAFQTWRYIYERGEVGQVQTVDYEFHCLDNAALAIRRKIIDYAESGRSPSA